jgi:phosphoserine phosphatase
MFFYMPLMAAFMLPQDGWEPQVHRTLTEIIISEQFNNKNTVFDLDDTILAGDIGDATLAVLAERGLLNNIPTTLKPVLNLLGQSYKFDDFDNALAYGHVFKQATSLLESASPNAPYYQWSAQILAGLTAHEVIDAAREAYARGLFVRPQMADLIASLLDHGYEVWIVSASPVLLVRFIVLEFLNPMLTSKNISGHIAPEHVIGMTTLMQNQNQELIADYPYVIQNQQYAHLGPEVLKNYYFTSMLLMPITSYAGKVMAIKERIKQKIYFGAGDSFNDMDFLIKSEHRLFLLKYHDTQLVSKAMPVIRSWLIQAINFEGELVS